MKLNHILISVLSAILIVISLPEVSSAALRAPYDLMAQSTSLSYRNFVPYTEAGRVSFYWHHSWTGRGGYEFSIRRAGDRWKTYNVGSGASHKMHLPRPDHLTTYNWRVRAYRVYDYGRRHYGEYSQTARLEVLPR